MRGRRGGRAEGERGREVEEKGVQREGGGREGMRGGREGRVEGGRWERGEREVRHAGLWPCYHHLRRCSSRRNYRLTGGRGDPLPVR